MANHPNRRSDNPTCVVTIWRPDPSAPWEPAPLGDFGGSQPCRQPWATMVAPVIARRADIISRSHKGGEFRIIECKQSDVDAAGTKTIMRRHRLTPGEQRGLGTLREWEEYQDWTWAHPEVLGAIEPLSNARIAEIIRSLPNWQHHYRAAEAHFSAVTT